MSPNKAVPSPWAVILLLIGAMILPRLQADRARADHAISEESIAQAEAVDYARERLWTDFLASRDETVPGLNLPLPSLTEYRGFLGSLGLTETGSTVELIGFPPLHEVPDADRIEVRYTRESRESLSLLVSLWQDEHRMTPAGMLVIERTDRGMLVCRCEQSSESFWSYWPITPQPLLP